MAENTQQATNQVCLVSSKNTKNIMPAQPTKLTKSDILFLIGTLYSKAVFNYKYKFIRAQFSITKEDLVKKLHQAFGGNITVKHSHNNKRQCLIDEKYNSNNLVYTIQSQSDLVAFKQIVKDLPVYCKSELIDFLDAVT